MPGQEKDDLILYSTYLTLFRGQTTATTLPSTHAKGTGPNAVLSSLCLLLSPSTQQKPSPIGSWLLANLPSEEHQIAESTSTYISKRTSTYRRIRHSRSRPVTRFTIVLVGSTGDLMYTKE